MREVFQVERTTESRIVILLSSRVLSENRPSLREATRLPGRVAALPGAGVGPDLGLGLGPDLDLPGLGGFRLGQRQGEHPVLVPSLRRVRVDRRGQRDGPLEGAETPLPDMPALVLF